MNLSAPFARMIMDTFLREQRENIRTGVEHAVELVESFDSRFQALEMKIDQICASIAKNEAREELLEVLEDIADGKTPEEALEDLEAELMLEGGNNG